VSSKSKKVWITFHLSDEDRSDYFNCKQLDRGNKISSCNHSADFWRRMAAQYGFERSTLKIISEDVPLKFKAVQRRKTTRHCVSGRDTKAAIMGSSAPALD